ncbi:MAG: hypothetical protein HYU99_07070 [Deltaproteobacteria bacterium]|nr:hypothetical protein [Deltaproteobacteria bacterium]
MDKKTLYVSFFNALIGVLVSLLLKGNLMIGVLIFIFLLTILWIERRWAFEKIFRKKVSFAVVGYAVFFLAVAGVLSLLTRSNRDSAVIVKQVGVYLDHLKPDEYKAAYGLLSAISKKNYSEAKFVSDHRRVGINVQDYRIDKVTINGFDTNKAVAEVSSPFLLYGQDTLALDLVKEGPEWKIVLSPTMVASSSRPSSPGLPTGEEKEKKKKGRGKVSNFFRSIF